MLEAGDPKTKTNYILCLRGVYSFSLNLFVLTKECNFEVNMNHLENNLVQEQPSTAKDTGFGIQRPALSLWPYSFFSYLIWNQMLALFVKSG